jgi:hypothetical protein
MRLTRSNKASLPPGGILRAECNFSLTLSFLRSSTREIQHELHLWIYYMSKFLNTSEFIIDKFAAHFQFIIIINSQHLKPNPNWPHHPDTEGTALVSREVTSVQSRCSISFQMHERLRTCLLIVPVQNERW